MLYRFAEEDDNITILLALLAREQLRQACIGRYGRRGPYTHEKAQELFDHILVQAPERWWYVWRFTHFNTQIVELTPASAWIATPSGKHDIIVDDLARRNALRFQRSVSLSHGCCGC